MNGFKDLMTEPSEKPSEVPKPSLCVDEKQMPEIKNWPLGKVYTLKARLVTKTESVDDKPAHADFEIVGVAGKETDDEEETSDSSSEDDDSSEEEGEEYE